MGEQALNVAKKFVLDSAKDFYNEDDVKSKLLSQLESIQDDLKVLRNLDFRAARDTLASWQSTAEPIGSTRNRDRLRLVSESAARAVHAVPNPLDKVTAVYFLIVADYHLVALEKSPPDWVAGKARGPATAETVRRNVCPTASNCGPGRTGTRQTSLFQG